MIPGGFTVGIMVRSVIAAEEVELLVYDTSHANRWLSIMKDLAHADSVGKGSSTPAS